MAAKEKPSVGRIVWFRFRQTAIKDRPAIITAVDEEEDTVNLTVFDDHAERHVTGIYEAAKAPIDDDGVAANTWRWPVRS